LKVLKCGAGEGWSRSVEQIMREMMKCYESRRVGISYNNKNRRANWTDHILHMNCLLKTLLKER